ncbi:MAG: Rab family GTPase [Promethearchaeota archaeon]
MKGSSKETDISLKIIVVGDAAVGKTAIAGRYTTGKSESKYKSTLGTDIFNKVLRVEGRNVSLLIYDTAGQERFRALVERYFRGAIGALLVYDITNRESFENLPTWARQVDRFANKALKLVIGNKSDLNDKMAVESEEGKGMGKQLGASFLETSAKDGSNIDEVFEKIAQYGIDRIRGRIVS